MCRGRRRGRLRGRGQGGDPGGGLLWTGPHQPACFCQRRRLTPRRSHAGAGPGGRPLQRREVSLTSICGFLSDCVSVSGGPSPHSGCQHFECADPDGLSFFCFLFFLHKATPRIVCFRQWVLGEYLLKRSVKCSGTKAEGVVVFHALTRLLSALPESPS